MPLHFYSISSTRTYSVWHRVHQEESLTEDINYTHPELIEKYPSLPTLPFCP